MDLADHARAGSHPLQPALDRDHRQFDHIGAGTLDRGVDRDAFGVGAQHAVGGGQVGDQAPPAEERLDVAGQAGAFQQALEPGLDGRIGLEITLDEAGGLLASDAELLSQAVRAHPINNSEIDHLGLRPHLTGDFGGLNPEDLTGGLAVDILTFLIGGTQRGIPRNVGQDA